MVIVFVLPFIFLAVSVRLAFLLLRVVFAILATIVGVVWGLLTPDRQPAY